MSSQCVCVFQNWITFATPLCELSPLSSISFLVFDTAHALYLFHKLSTTVIAISTPYHLFSQQQQTPHPFIPKWNPRLLLFSTRAKPVEIAPSVVGFLAESRKKKEIKRGSVFEFESIGQDSVNQRDLAKLRPVSRFSTFFFLSSPTRCVGQAFQVWRSLIVCR